MIEIGKYNELEVLRQVEIGLILDGKELGDILLPKRYVPKEFEQTLNIFLYLDSEDRLIATTETPKAIVNECALLKVESVSTIGAFLNWDLPKDLLLPYSEQKERVREGQWVVAKILLDKKSNRLFASTKLNKYLDKEESDFSYNEEVDILIHSRTDLGHKAIINHTFWGMLYSNEVFRIIKQGQKLKAFIKNVREDGKVDLTLQKSGYQQIDSVSSDILEYIKAQGGSIPLTDKSSPEEIYRVFHISKKNFKKAIGTLYKSKLITLESSCINVIK